MVEKKLHEDGSRLILSSKSQLTLLSQFFSDFQIHLDYITCAYACHLKDIKRSVLNKLRSTLSPRNLDQYLALETEINIEPKKLRSTLSSRNWDQHWAPETEINIELQKLRSTLSFRNWDQHWAPETEINIGSQKLRSTLSPRNWWQSANGPWDIASDMALMSRPTSITVDLWRLENPVQWNDLCTNEMQQVFLQNVQHDLRKV